MSARISRFFACVEVFGLLPLIVGAFLALILIVAGGGLNMERLEVVLFLVLLLVGAGATLLRCGDYARSGSLVNADPTDLLRLLSFGSPAAFGWMLISLTADSSVPITGHGLIPILVAIGALPTLHIEIATMLHRRSNYRLERP